MLLCRTQALPVQREWLQFSRLRLRVDKPIPLNLSAKLPPLVLYLRGRAGFIHGDLPPYEPIGGTNSVRGYAGECS